MRDRKNDQPRKQCGKRTTAAKSRTRAIRKARKIKSER